MARASVVVIALALVVVADTGCPAVAPTFPELGDSDAASSTGPAASSSEGAGDETTSTTTTSSTSDAAVDGSGSTTTSAGDSTTEVVPACTSALLVTGNLDTATSQDAPFYERLIELGYTVTVVHNAASTTADADGKCLIVISMLGIAAEVNTKFRDVAVPVLTWEYNLYMDMAMVTGGPGGQAGVADPQDQIEIVLSDHPLAAGLMGLVPIFSGGGRISWGMPAPGATIVATLPGDPLRATLFAFDTGQPMASGFVAPAPRVGLPGAETTMPATPQSVEIFEAAVFWATQ